MPAFHQNQKFLNVSRRRHGSDGQLATRTFEKFKSDGPDSRRIKSEQRIWKKNRELGWTRNGLSNERASFGHRMQQQISQRCFSRRIAGLVHQTFHKVR